MGVDRVQEIKARAAKGSRVDYLRLVDMAIKGVPGAREALEALAPPGDSKDAADREAFWAELADVAARLDEAPNSLESLVDLRRRARVLGICEEVQALGLESYRLRRLGYLGAAGELLEEAESIGGHCAACLLDLGRRQAILLSALGDHPAALERIQGSLDGYRRLCGPGHDLEGDGVASCLAIRGKIRVLSGDAVGGTHDLALSLKRWPPQSPAFLVCLLNLGVALERSGLREEAYRLLRKPRLRFRTLPLCAQRAVFDLLDGQLEYERGTKNRDRGRSKIRDAVAGFAALGMPDEFLRAAADYVKSIRRNPEAVNEFLKEIHDESRRLVTAPEHLRRLRELFDLSRELSHGLPSRSVRQRLEQALERAIEQLRAGIETPGLPCLIS